MVEQGGIREEYRESRERERDTSAKMLVAGYGIETLGGITALVLPILGLVGILPNWMPPITCIVIGACYLLKESAIAARFSSLTREARGSYDDRNIIGSAMGIEFLGGAAGIALGVLAFLGVEPLVLIPAAIITFGVMLLTESAESTRLQTVESAGRYELTANRTVLASAGVESLLGFAAIVIGIVALAGAAVNVLTLELVGLLCIGAGLTAVGGSVTSKVSYGLAH